MSKRIDLTNKKFGRLLVIKYSHSDKLWRSYWHVKCDCGKKKIVQGHCMVHGSTKSCGCLQLELAVKINYKHGMSNTAIQKSWADMRNRCLNSNYKRFEDYGGRGIKICERWMKFEKFFKDMGVKPEGMTLERINNNGDYEPDNCKWATQQEQNNNKRNNHILVYKGISLTMAQWAKQLGIKYGVIQGRLRLGWSIEKTLGASQ